MPNDKEKELALTIPPGCHGHDLQELMYKFVSWFSLANEKRDKLADKVARQKLLVELVEAEAMLRVDEDIEANKEGRVMVDTRKARALTTKVTINNDMVLSPYDAKCDLAAKQLELSMVESKAKQIERLISVCQSGLSFDRQEAAMPQR